MKRFKQILIFLAAVLPVVYTSIAVFFFLPDTVAAHFGADGTPNRYGSKYEAFLLPAFCLVVYLVYVCIRKFALRSSTDENSRTERNFDIIDTVLLSMLVLYNALCVMVLFLMKNPEMMKNTENVIFPIIATIIGIMFIVIGNIMPKTKPNSFVGMRLSWSMDTDEHWYIANRAGGIAMVLSGVVTVICGLVFRSSAYLFGMIISLIVSLTVATIYSYVIIKKK
ncbi:MAG: DUF1648 domain-containing protein [Ruminococcus sp.]|nr:DUF1648 domain-containing protein [Ruminococcus sp.]